MSNIYTANQDIRDYMADHCVSQKQLAEQMGVNVWKVNTLLKKELSQKEKEEMLKCIDAIDADRKEAIEQEPEPEATQDPGGDTTNAPRFQIGDRVKVPSKAIRIGIVGDIWHSLLKNNLMYAVDFEDGSRGLYTEEQLEPAPLPIDYSFEAHVDGNVAVVTMIAKQGEKTWVYARGHAHILHDGEVGMAQAISYAARRMFESLDKQQENKIYFKDQGNEKNQGGK